VPDTNSTFQLRERDPADVENATDPDQYRIFFNVLTGLLSIKDSVGNVFPIGGAQTIATTMVDVVGPAAYAAAARQTILCDPSGGAITINLPPLVGLDGFLIEIINVTPDVTPITVAADGAEQVISSFGSTPTFELNTPNERRYIRASEAQGAWIVTG